MKKLLSYFFLTLFTTMFFALIFNPTKCNNIPQPLTIYKNNVIISDTLLNIVRESEAFSPTIYICPSGFKTIGYGFKLTKKDTITHITQSEANIVLINKLTAIYNKVRDRYNVSQCQAEALTSLIYNIGWDRFAKSNFSKTLKREGNKAIKEINFLSFRKANGEILRGLEIRRGKEWELWKK